MPVRRIDKDTEAEGTRAWILFSQELVKLLLTPFLSLYILLSFLSTYDFSLYI